MIVDAILRAYARPARTAATAGQPFRLPENLRRYFAARAAQRPTTPADACCDQTACCEPAAKPACCGAEPQPDRCGCR
jgi:hypothetical protein